MIVYNLAKVAPSIAVSCFSRIGFSHFPSVKDNIQADTRAKLHIVLACSSSLNHPRSAELDARSNPVTVDAKICSNGKSGAIEFHCNYVTSS